MCFEDAGRFSSALRVRLLAGSSLADLLLRPEEGIARGFGPAAVRGGWNSRFRLSSGRAAFGRSEA